MFLPQDTLAYFWIKDNKAAHITQHAHSPAWILFSSFHVQISTCHFTGLQNNLHLLRVVSSLGTEKTCEIRYYNSVLRFIDVAQQVYFFLLYNSQVFWLQEDQLLLKYCHVQISTCHFTGLQNDLHLLEWCLP
jgi:hypothetical protein